MALYEYAAASSNEAAATEFFYFRIADNVHPQNYIDIALNRSAALPSWELENLKSDEEIRSEILHERNLTKRLNIWKANYLFVLKTAELIRLNLPKREAMERFLEWQVTEVFHNAVASLFCMVALSHQPYRKMMKEVRSNDPSKLARGINNATWDLCYISQWGKSIRTHPEHHWLLCSNDEALRAIGSSLFIENNRSIEKKLAELFVRYWGKVDGAYLLKKYLEISVGSEIGSEKRDVEIKRRFSLLDQLVSDIEMRLNIQPHLPLAQ